MKRVLTAIAVAATTVAAGCATVRHDFSPYHAAGTALPVEVTVKAKAAAQVAGTVHHRTNGQGRYQSVPMRQRADQLWAILPTEGFSPDATVEYYIDVSRNGRLHPLGSPASPYVVTFLDEQAMILSNLHEEHQATDAHSEVRLVLHAANQPIGRPSAVYQIPGIPGSIRADMETDGAGNYHVVIPPRVVRPGTWRYAIELTVDGDVVRLPAHGFRSFVVDPGYPPEMTASEGQAF